MFADQLRALGIEPSAYLQLARKAAKAKRYNPEELVFSNRATKKLSYKNVHFGAVGYNDYIIYKMTAPDIAKRKRLQYRARATETALRTQCKTSPASLALNILWYL